MMRMPLTLTCGRLLLLFPPSSVLLHPRRTTGGQAGCTRILTPEVECHPGDAPELLEVELLVPHTDGDDTDIFPEIEGHQTDRDDTAETITTIDTFARAKVANFMKRLLQGANSSTWSVSPQTSSSGQLAMEVREVQTAENEEKLFHAKLRLPLPQEYGERWGEGLAPTEKEAELVAAMHAERVIDALGFSMFQLTSKQTRHAEAARSAGRWAPMPGEGVRPATTPSPPRLQLLREGAMKALERRLQIDKMVFSTVTAAAFTPMKLTLASPFLFDHGSVYRVRQFFASYNCNIQRFCRVTALHKCAGAAGGNTPTLVTTNYNDDNKIFVAQLRLPIEARFGERIACGKAPTKKEAYTLACMHAELIIDALGLALYPSNREKQEAHAEECRRVNRWCSEPGDCNYHFTKVSPPPLQLSRRSETTTAAMVDTTTSLESVLMSHAKAIEGFTNVVNVHVLNPSARRAFLNYMVQHGGGVNAVDSPFFVEALGIKDHLVYRATVTVPVPPVLTNEEEKKQLNGSVEDNSAAVVTTTDTSAIFPSFVAIGIGTSEMEAETAASMHAISVLELLNRPLPGGEAQCQAKPPQNITKKTVIPPPYRHVMFHIGRIMVPGLSATRVLGSSQTLMRQRGLTVDLYEKRLQRARAELPRTDWSLDADADGYIIMDPTVNVREGRNYVHTLPSVRQADRFAIVRLRDYMERHGKRLESVIEKNVLDTDEGLKRWVVKVTLPVPIAFGHVVAHGEAYAEDEALVMCAVHAELVLDELGVALYDLPALQEKHCDATGMLGRWAPYETKAKRRVDHIPPPVRKEHAGSCLWARLSLKKGTMGVNTLSPVEKGNGETSRAPSLDKGEKKVRLQETNEETAAVEVTKIEINMEVSQASVGNGISDDALCDLAELVFMHPSDIFRHAPRLIDIYCRRNGVDVSRSMRQYNVGNPVYGLVHRALMELPLPAQFGRRYAVGCASTKKDAFALCCMHAVYILGELGVPIYTGAKQAEYAAIARSRGRNAPMPGDPMKPGDTRSPPGLKSLQDIHMEKPLVPVRPTHAELGKPFVWNSYVTACRRYIQQQREQTVLEALFTQNKSPRSGVDVEDNGLEVVEALPLFTNAKSKLAQKCAAARLPPPPPQSFRFEVYGRAPNRRYLVEQQVAGTPFVARGMGTEGHESVIRAAMHYEYIVGIISRWQQQDRDETRLGARHWDGDLFDATIRDFTPRGKLSIMALYTTLCAPFLPLRLTLKERNSTSSVETSFVALIEVEDESGLRMAGKGEDRTNVWDAQNRAIAELFKQLQRKSVFQMIIQLMQTYPGLRTEGVVHYANEGKALMSLQSLLVERNSSLIPPMEKPLLFFSDSSDLLNVVRLLSEAEQHLNSLELQLLLNSVKRAFRSAKMAMPTPTHKMPTAARYLLSSMGLTAPDGSGQGWNCDIEVNPLGVAVSLLATCLPPTCVRPEGGNQSLGSALPLQLAKLLLAGCLMGCKQLCIRVAAHVLSSVVSDSNEGNYDGGCQSGDLLEFVGHALPLKAHGFAVEISKRLQLLASQLQQSQGGSFSSALSGLLVSSPFFTIAADDPWGAMCGELGLKEQARLRLSIAFATFPRVFVQRKSAADDMLREVMMESRDRKRAVRIGMPTSLAESFRPRSCNSGAYSCCSLPYFSVFDAIPSSGATAEQSPPVLGAFVPPCGLLLASSCCDEPRMVALSGDLSNVAILDGFLPLVTRLPESLSALVELRLALKWYWSGLKPLPIDEQNVVDKLLVEKHTMTHVAEAGLLD